MPSIKSIVYKPKHMRQPADSVGYLRVPLTEAVLMENYGIAGDRKGGHPRRNLNVMDDVTLAELGAENYPIDAGVLGENIVISGIDLRTLLVGTQLKLGDQAVIEIGKPRIPCEQLTALDARMPAMVMGRVGAMCRVVIAGTIHIGDEIDILIASTSAQTR